MFVQYILINVQLILTESDDNDQSQIQDYCLFDNNIMMQPNNLNTDQSQNQKQGKSEEITFPSDCCKICLKNLRYKELDYKIW